MFFRGVRGNAQGGGDVAVAMTVEHEFSDLRLADGETIAPAERIHVGADFPNHESGHLPAKRNRVEVKRFATVCRHKAHGRIAAARRGVAERRKVIAEHDEELDVVAGPQAGGETLCGLVRVSEAAIAKHEDRNAELFDDGTRDRSREPVFSESRRLIHHASTGAGPPEGCCERSR